VCETRKRRIDQITSYTLASPFGVDTQQADPCFECVDVQRNVSNGHPVAICDDDPVGVPVTAPLNPRRIELVTPIVTEMWIRIEARIAMRRSRDIPEGGNIRAGYRPGCVDDRSRRDRQRTGERHANVHETKLRILEGLYGCRIICGTEAVQAINAVGCAPFEYRGAASGIDVGRNTASNGDTKER
jgi:hypothetical protein